MGQCSQEEKNIHVCTHAHIFCMDRRVRTYNHTLYQYEGVSAPTSSNGEPEVTAGGKGIGDGPWAQARRETGGGWTALGDSAVGGGGNSRASRRLPPPNRRVLGRP